MFNVESFLLLLLGISIVIQGEGFFANSTLKIQDCTVGHIKRRGAIVRPQVANNGTVGSDLQLFMAT